MAERRSIEEAMLSPVKLAFIQSGELPDPVKPQTSVKVAREEVNEDVSLKPALEKRGTEMPRTRSRNRRSTRHDHHAPNNYLDLPGIVNLLVPLTTRLQPATAVALRRAGLEQRLRGQNPATVQEIAEEAITAWLLDHGFLAT